MRNVWTTERGWSRSWLLAALVGVLATSVGAASTLETELVLIRAIEGKEVVVGEQRTERLPLAPRARIVNDVPGYRGRPIEEVLPAYGTLTLRNEPERTAVLGIRLVRRVDTKRLERPE